MFDLTGFRLMRRVAHGRSRSLAGRESRRRSRTVGDSRSATSVHHCIRTSAMTRCVFRRIIFFHELGRPFFFCFVSFLILSLFFAFFFFGTRLLTLRNLRYVATRLELCLEHLGNTTTYEKLKKDPSDALRLKVNKTLKGILTKHDFSTTFINNLQTPTTARTQHFYGLPKTHKTNLKIQPIVSACSGILAGFYSSCWNHYSVT